MVKSIIICEYYEIPSIKIQLFRKAYKTLPVPRKLIVTTTATEQGSIANYFAIPANFKKIELIFSALVLWKCFRRN